MGDTMLKHALDYLARGWSIVPCKPFTKQPYVKWRDYQTRKPTPAEVHTWWRKWPRAGIALVTGTLSGIAVVDIDQKSGGTTAGHEITPLMAKTPGGTHLFYETNGRGPAPTGANYDSPGGKADLRGDGGYVLLPPSLHPSGQRYKWIVQGEPSPIPGWVEKIPRASDKQPDTGERKTWLRELIANGCEDGKRNDGTSSYAGYLAKQGLPVDVALETIQLWNETKNSPPLPAIEVETTVRSTYRTAESRSNGSQGQGKSREQTPAVDRTFKVVPYGHYMGKNAWLETRWVFDGWLPDRTIAMLVAAPGSFKTWLEFDMAVSIAGGFPFLGKVNPGRVGPVIMAQQEDSPGEIVDRIATLHCVKAGIAKPKRYSDGTFVLEFPGEIPIFFHEDANLRFDDAHAMETFRKAIEQIKPVACFIDPLYSAASAEGYMAESVAHMMALKRWRSELNTSFVLAHHTSKSGTDARSRRRLWGSQFLNGWLETGLQVHRPDETAEWCVVERHTKAEGPMGAVRIDFEINTHEDWRYAPQVQDLTPEETKALLAGDEPSGGKPYGERKGPAMSKHAKKLLARIEHSPASISTLTGELRLTPGEVQAALAELMRTAQIVQKGDHYATIVDAATLSI